MTVKARVGPPQIGDDSNAGLTHYFHGVAAG